MSEQQPVGMLQQLKQQHAQYCLQRDQTQINYQQLVGAIFACEVMIKQHEEALKKAFEEQVEKDKAACADEPQEPNENQGVINDGEVKEQGTEQAAQE